MIFGKPWDFWIAMIGAALYVATRDAEKAPTLKRLYKTLASAAMAYSLSDELAPFTRNSESLATVIIMVLGLAFLDIAFAIVNDRELVMNIVRGYYGRGKDDKKP